MTEISTNPERAKHVDAPLRTGVAVADASFTALKASAKRAFNGRSVGLLWGAHAVEGAEAVVQLAFFDDEDALEPAYTKEITLTAGKGRNSADKYLSPMEPIPNLGWPFARIFVVSLTGALDLYLGTAI